MRSLALIRELAARGWDVSLLGLETGVQPDAGDLRELQEVCAEVRLAPFDVGRIARMARMGADLARGRPFQHSMFRSPRVVRSARRWIDSARFDAVVAGGLYMLAYVPQRRLESTLLDSHNVDTERIATMAAALWPHPRGIAARVQQRPVERYERRAAAAVGGVAAVSQHEAAWFERHAPGRVSVIPNGVDCARVRAREGTGAGGPILFVGSMDYSANVDAARSLLDDIAPRLRRPDARIALVGALPPPALRAAAAACPIPVEVTGRVAEIAPWFQASRLLAVPLRIGGGTRLKILEAMAHGVPVVTTSLGCEGLELEAGRDLLVADDAESFARSVDRLLGDDDLVRALATHGAQTVRRRYDWKQIGGVLETALLALDPAARPSRVARDS